MIRSLRDKTTQDVFDGLNSKASRKLPVELHAKARRVLDLINAAGNLNDLKVPPGNRLEGLKGDLRGFHSVRINNQWRVVFRWTDKGVEDVQIKDYH